MKKIRIGNDIRLAVDLQKLLVEEVENNTESQETEETSEAPVSSINVRQVSAYLINTTKLAEYKQKAKDRSGFIGRFPREPFSHDYNTTPWCLCGCGKPTWNAYPTNAGCVYSGFGTQPYKGLKELKQLAKSIQYRANCYTTKEPNIILVDFPADQQLHAGVYTLILVVKLYTPGYTNNIKTVSADMPNVFELVKKTEDTIEESGETIDTGVTINPDAEDVTPDTPDTPDIPDVVYNDIYVNEGSISNGILSLGRTDDNTVDVDLGGIVGWYEADNEEEEL